MTPAERARQIDAEEFAAAAAASRARALAYSKECQERETEAPQGWTRFKSFIRRKGRRTREPRR